MTRGGRRIPPVCVLPHVACPLGEILTRQALDAVRGDSLSPHVAASFPLRRQHSLKVRQRPNPPGAPPFATRHVECVHRLEPTPGCHSRARDAKSITPGRKSIAITSSSEGTAPPTGPWPYLHESPEQTHSTAAADLDPVDNARQQPDAGSQRIDRVPPAVHAKFGGCSGTPGSQDEFPAAMDR